jgi:hypothetical protein
MLGAPHTEPDGRNIQQAHATRGWLGVASARYRCAVATVIAWSDRRARLALILAALGLPSFGVTVPAAVWLGVGSVRQQRLVSGGEPAMGLIALVVAALSGMMLSSVLQKTVEVLGPGSTWPGVLWGIALATVAWISASAILRIHPERRGALRVARSSLALATAGGTALFVGLIAALD